MSKFVGKFRQERDYSDDWNSTKNFNSKKKRKGENSEIRRMKMQQQYEDSYGYEDVDKRYRFKN